jgi:hypothetical protein
MNSVGDQLLTCNGCQPAGCSVRLRHARRTNNGSTDGRTYWAAPARACRSQIWLITMMWNDYVPSVQRQRTHHPWLHHRTRPPELTRADQTLIDRIQTSKTQSCHACKAAER